MVISETEAGKDNRNIVDTSDSQKVSREEIEEMRRKGEKGEVRIFPLIYQCLLHICITEQLVM